MDCTLGKMEALEENPLMIFFLNGNVASMPYKYCVYAHRCVQFPDFAKDVVVKVKTDS